jgi:hypothetical protein
MAVALQWSYRGRWWRYSDPAVACIGLKTVLRWPRSGLVVVRAEARGGLSVAHGGLLVAYGGSAVARW